MEEQVFSSSNWLDKPIEELGLPARAYNALYYAGCRKVRDVVSRTPRDLLMLRNMGRKSVNAIIAALEPRGLRLGSVLPENNRMLVNQPKAGAWDFAHTMAKAALSAVPYAGGPLAEFFAAIVEPPLSKRRWEWMESIAEGLKALEEKVKGFKPEALSRNDMFITTIMHASQSAIRNHQKEKLEALRNAVLNAALPNAPEDDLQLMFLDFVDSLTPWHLRILQFLDDPIEFARKKGKTYPDSIFVDLPEVIMITFPLLKDQKEFTRQIVRDLTSKGLLDYDINRLDNKMMWDKALIPRIAKLGKVFTSFISSPVALARAFVQNDA